MKRNCPNCGAPYEVKLNKCPYCGTSYFDMSCLDMDGHTPCYIKVKTMVGSKEAYVTLKAIPRMGDIEITTDTKDIPFYDGVIKKFVTHSSLGMNISFEGIAESDRYITMEITK